MHARSLANRALHPESAEDILGQFYFALGQGAGTMRIRREAIAALRRRYYLPIQASGAAWPDMASDVLSLLTQVGRLASLLATQAGRTAISAADFMQARQMVEASVQSIHQDAGLSAGPICPRFDGDVDSSEIEQGIIEKPTEGPDSAIRVN